MKINGLNKQGTKAQFEAIGASHSSHFLPYLDEEISVFPEHLDIKFLENENLDDNFDDLLEEIF